MDVRVMHRLIVLIMMIIIISTTTITNNNNVNSVVIEGSAYSKHKQHVHQDVETDIDNNGYIIYCPCMGRFGNQAAHLLGSLAFARKLERTLVLPPWPTQRGFVKFDQWFNMQVLKTYHSVITASTFMTEIAPKIWPVGGRQGFCYKVPHVNHPDQNRCNLKHGSPFTEFWNHLKVDFDSTSFYNLSYSQHDTPLWKKLFPVEKYPVLAFKGPPASFPVKAENVDIHRYLWWNDNMVAAASNLLYNYIQDEDYVAIHLRNGPDWARACEHAIGKTSFMSSPQCTGYGSQALITKEMCLPSTATVVKWVEMAVVQANVSKVYVLTDQHPLIAEIESGLSDLDVKAVHGDPDIPQYDLIIAAKAKLFVGNCISSFTAFIKREREHISRKPTWFFGVLP